MIESLQPPRSADARRGRRWGWGPSAIRKAKAAGMTGRFTFTAGAIAAASLAALLAVGCAARAPRVQTGSASAGVAFSQVDEILHESCEHCHNADDEKGGLLMDSYASLVAGGEHGNALVPGDSASSRLMQMIEGKLKPRMPYKEDPLPRA